MYSKVGCVLLCSMPCVWSIICVVSFGPCAMCCWYASHLYLPCIPLTGPGKRVCVMSAASVDWPYFRLQAARPRGGACPQRLSLPDLRGLCQAGQYHWPFAQRGKAHTRIAMETKPIPPPLSLIHHRHNFPSLFVLACAGALGAFISCICQSIIVSCKCNPWENRAELLTHRVLFEINVILWWPELLISSLSDKQ